MKNPMKIHCFVRSLIRVLICIVAMSAGDLVHAALLFHEPFAYSDGELGAVSSGAWSLHSGTGGQTISDGQLVIDDAGTGDYNRSLSGVSSGSLFARFNLIVSDVDPPSSSASDKYFASFGSSSYDGRLLVNEGATDDTFVIRVSVDGTTFASWGSELDAGSLYDIVFAYDFIDASTSRTRLWVNPTSEASASVNVTAGVPPSSISAFSFRIAGASDGDKTVDDLFLATSFDGTVVPEPSTLIAGGGGPCHAAGNSDSGRKEESCRLR